MTTIPNDAEELTPEWFSEVLEAEITGAEVIDAHTGTTGRAKVRLTSTADVPETVFLKLQPFTPEQREFVAMVGMGVSESRLYAQAGDDLPVRIPKVWHSDYNADDNTFIMVLEDLDASGCRFTSAEDDDVLDTAHAVMDELAVLHAAYWNSDLSWLKAPAGMRNNKQGDKVVTQALGFMQSAVDQFADELPPAFRELSEFCMARFGDVNGLYREGVRTLVHGDTHIGNMFIDADGRLGLYDWAVTSALPGMRDIAYFLTNSIPTELRRENEQALIARYCAGLAERGVDFDTTAAWEQYRLFSIYSWSGCTATASVGSRWQPFEIAHKAMVRTTAAIDDLDSLGLLVDRLGAR
ncbi:MAG: thiamine kinase-like enzyme [Candidatus Aldehydirespiratoraceae bacterium]|jgi:thiamine kinase-like enzyme